MNVILLTALLFQVMAVVLLRYRLGRHWLRRPTVLIMLADVVYQGLSPVLMALPSIGTWDTYRIGVQQGFVNSATLLMSGGMFVFTVAYLMTHPERVNAAAGMTGISYLEKALDWKFLTAVSIPLAVLTYQGRGFNNGVTAIGSVSSNLAATFFIVLIALAAFSFLLKHGVRWFIPVLIVQSLILAAAGERNPVITDAIALILLLLFSGSRPSARQLRGAAALTLVAILAVTGLRAEKGRTLFQQDNGLSARISALGDGLTKFTTTSPAGVTGPSIPVQTVIRLDGVDFGGAILQSLSFGQPPLSASYVLDSLLLVVPSALWPSKLAHGNALNPAIAETDDFGLQQVNFLPTLPGLYIGFLSAPWLIVFLAFIGLLCGWGERWLFRRCTPVRFVLLAGAVIAALFYEKGLPGMLVALRGAVVIAVIVKLIEVMRRPRGVRPSYPIGREVPSPR